VVGAAIVVGSAVVGGAVVGDVVAVVVDVVVVLAIAVGVPIVDSAVHAEATTSRIAMRDRFT